jgi:hypothetical protein
VERVGHPGDPDIFQAGHALCVHSHQDLDTVPSPDRDLGGRDARVEPPGDAGVPQVIRTAQERRGGLLGCERAGAASCQTRHQVDGWMTLPYSLRKRRPSGPAPKRSM